MFDHIRAADRVVLLLNTLLLMAVAFLPFATSVLAGALRSGTRPANGRILLRHRVHTPRKSCTSRVGGRRPAVRELVGRKRSASFSPRIRCSPRA